MTTRFRRFGLAFLLTVFCAGVAALANDLTALPTKLQLFASQVSVKQNQRVTLKVQLADADNKAVPTETDLTIQITDSRGNQQTQVLSKGHSSAEMFFVAKSAGLIRVTATEPHLLSGGALLHVIPAGAPTTNESTHSLILPHLVVPPAADAADAARIEEHTEGLSHPPPPASAAPSHPHGGGGGGGGGAPPPPVVAAATAAPAAPAPPTIVGQPIIQLSSDISRPLIADGVDACSIYALVENPPQPSVKIILQPIDGVLSSGTIELNQANSYYASTTLTSTNPNGVTIRVATSTPNISQHDGDPLTIACNHPVHHLQVNATPNAISLLESAQVLVTLYNKAGQPTVTDYNRTVQVSVDGDAELSSYTTTIPSNQWQSAPLTLTPKHTGPIHLTASVTDLLPQTSEVTIRFPIFGLLLSVFGGCCGGFIAYVSDKDGKLTRILTGAITGCCLYWAVFYGVLIHLAIASAATSFFTAFVVPVVGGFAGSKVLDALFKALAPGGSG